MDIGIVSNFVDEFSGGIGVYTHQILKYLHKMDSENDYYLIHSSQSDLDIYDQYKEIIIPKNRLVSGWGANMFWRYVTLPFKLKKYKLDVVHDPYELGPFTFNLPFRKVITVHDLSPLILPELFKGGDVLLHKLLLKKTIKNADKIITVSYNSQRDLMEYLDVPEEDIEIIYNGVDEIFHPLKEEEVEKFKTQWNLPESFILSVGGLHPIKNLPRLLQAYSLARKEGLTQKLVVVGGVIDGAQEIFQTLKMLNMQKDVIFTGVVSNKDLLGLYNAADMFLYPCLYAGFGIPPLESMSCGTPVITSCNSSLPEIVGDGALLVDPYQVENLTHAMKLLVEDEDLKNTLIKKGIKRAAMFNWKKTAYQTMKTYREVYNY
ncbi:MAG: hypothetical protein PWQ15_1744 [Methanobacterium sp.]|uniref:glycosyltransferase family 4 protein n=1 Tax=Methanobacterium sp. TaxID=2164 RepID=UPI0024AC6C7D|nr:glycosyltransferase family 1 protein [Methanobacterium sp.]MDI3550641.1 hypothetical protein [Methanobacterium sp.]